MTNNNQQSQVLSFGVTLVFAVAAGLAVGNLYWAQPLLAQIAADFGVATSQGGYLVTATTVGYALGIFFIVPLGDVLHRRKLITALIIVSSAFLLLCAAAPSFEVLAIALALMGITTVSGQIILPLARDLASAENQGSAVGLIVSGITIGILVARTTSGLVADIFSWRAIYIAAAVIDVVLALIIWRSVPDQPKRERIAYPKLIADVFMAPFRVKTLPRIMIITGFSFGIVFNMFWTTATFLLSGEPHNLGTFQIGLVSLAGVLGALVGPRIGKLEDRGLGIPAIGASVAVLVVTMVLALFAQSSLVLFVVAAALLSVGLQGVSVLCQSRTLGLVPGQSSRLNTVFVVNNFLFGAVGNLLAVTLWNAAGWPGIVAGAIVAALLSLGMWVVSRDAFRESDERLAHDVSQD